MRLVYVELNPSQIYNRLAIENLTCWSHMPEWRDAWWEDETIALRKQFADAWRYEFDKTMNHFNGLRASLKLHGMISPISLIGGPPRDKFLQNPNYNVTQPTHIPPRYINDLDNLLTVQPFGGSRVTVAEELEFESIPCVVHDFTNRFPNAPQVTSANYKEWFGPQYLFAGQPPYIRDGAMNDKHRKAQQNAHKIAREKMLNV